MNPAAPVTRTLTSDTPLGASVTPAAFSTGQSTGTLPGTLCPTLVVDAHHANAELFSPVLANQPFGDGDGILARLRSARKFGS